MEQKEKKLILISVLASLIIHVLIFLGLYLINKKPQEEKEKIITLTLENLPKEEKKPSISEEKPIEKSIVKPPKPEPKPKPQPKQESIKPQVIPKPQPKPEPPKEKEQVKQQVVEKPQEEVKPQTSDNQPQPQQPQQQQTVESQNKSQQEENKQPTQIDLSKGRPDSFKQPEKKDVDTDGYLKELIRYLNQQAREKDLYPPLAKRLKIEGQVIVRVTINEDGTIDENSIKIVERSGYNVLDKGAIEILKKLQPYKKPPKKITVEIPIVFQIIYM
ncbi:MAG: energy transducer TonB [Sulfurihydrogenibium sp.]|nr:MAG: energy transducer TonB [Sulfurihydrogenibium sp.]